MILHTKSEILIVTSTGLSVIIHNCLIIND